MRGQLVRPLLVAAALAAAAATYCPAQEPVISGTINATVSAAAGAGESPGFFHGTEDYANLRLKAEVGERGTVHAALNLIAASGANAAAAVAAGAAAGDNYTAVLELERLYVRIQGEAADTDLGLMRIAFGFGQAFRPSDFLNPPNPLLPDARPRGVLGLSASMYPSFDTKIQAFAVGGRDPVEMDGGGILSGLSMETHFNRASLQGLYAFQNPGDLAAEGRHRLGLSVKLEAGAGLVLDALYALEPGSAAGWNGLEAAVGADYSFLDGKLYVLLQYLYNGPGLLDSDDSLDVLYAAIAGGTQAAAFNRKNYLLAQGLYRYNDYTRFGLGWVSGLDDLSFSPALTVEHEPFQGFLLGLTARLSLDEWSLTGQGRHGELGPEYTGAIAMLSASAKLRF